MKTIKMLALGCLLTISAKAQTSYLMFEFMNVTEANGGNYQELESFWSKIHQERVKAGDLEEWSFWSLSPGGQAQHFQYLTVQQFTDPAKMMNMELATLLDRAKKAYPNMSEADLMAKLDGSFGLRTTGARSYVKIIDGTTSAFQLTPGILSSLALMKVEFNKMDTYAKYEKAESEVFKPIHQKAVDEGKKMGWGLGVVTSPVGSDTYASHMTWNFYKDVNQMLSDSPGDMALTPDQQKKVEDGLATRDLKYNFTCKLLAVTTRTE